MSPHRHFRMHPRYCCGKEPVPRLPGCWCGRLRYMSLLRRCGARAPCQQVYCFVSGTTSPFSGPLHERIVLDRACFQPRNSPPLQVDHQSHVNDSGIPRHSRGISVPNRVGCTGAEVPVLPVIGTFSVLAKNSDASLAAPDHGVHAICPRRAIDRSMVFSETSGKPLRRGQVVIFRRPQRIFGLGRPLARACRARATYQ